MNGSRTGNGVSHKRGALRNGAAKSPKVAANDAKSFTFSRPPERSVQWSSEALTQKNEAEYSLGLALGHLAAELSRSHSSSVVTDADVRNATERLVCGMSLDQPPLIIVGRMVSMALVFVGGLAFARGDYKNEPWLMVLGILMTGAFICIEELLYNYKRHR